jgi:hypothetical protein
MARTREAANDGKRSNGRGSVNNKSRLDGLFTSGDAGTGNADWGNCDPRIIQGVITTAQNVGAAITFGLSRDGGAHMLTILLAGDRQTLWFNGDADLDAEVLTVIAKLETLIS